MHNSVPRYLSVIYIHIHVYKFKANTDTVYLFKENNRFDIICCYKSSKKDNETNEGMLFKLFKHIYAPFLLKKWVRAAVMIIFFGWACSSIAVVRTNKTSNGKGVEKT